MKKNILVFPCGSEIALDIYSSVKYSTYFHLIGASSIDDHGKFIYEDYIPKLPYVNDKEFIPALKKIVKERNVDAIYPAMDMAITIIKQNENIIGCKVISSPLETTEICLSKDKTYRALCNDVLTPNIFNLNEEITNYPVFVKPKIGYGAKGTKKISSKTDLVSFVKDKDDLLILEYLPGEEYTVDCFTNKDGILLFSAARKRNRIKDGISVNTFFESNQKEFEEISLKINSKIQFRGAWFYQVKRNRDGRLCLLEIASRLGGSSLLSRGVGVNFALLSLFDAFGYEVNILKNSYYIELDRALESRYKTNLKYNNVYIDYDDCLILDKSHINTLLVKFIFQCINKGIKITLISKHQGNLNNKLSNFRLLNVFDEIIHLDQTDHKFLYIKEKDAIFIDDSYAERYEVFTNLNIPVFSPEMVDVLIEE